MRITNSNFYFITFTALAALLIIGLYFFSRKGDCCGECHIHEGHDHEQVTEQVVETSEPTSSEQILVESASQAPVETFVAENADVQK